MQFSLPTHLHKIIPQRLRNARSGRECCLSLCVLLNSFAYGEKLHAAEFKAGFAQVDVSTRAQIPMGGYGTFFLKTPRLNTAGVHDPLQAGALVLESAEGDLAALVSVDAVGLSGTQVSRIEARLRETLNPKLHVIIAATHTHHSPDTLGLWGALPRSGRNPRYGDQLETAIVQAVRDAYAARTDAKVSQKSGRHANDSSSSAAPEDIQDQFVSLNFYSQQQGTLLGTLTQWAAHPTVLGMENNALSADFVGAFRETMFRKMPAPHLFFNGAIGKVNPIVPAADDPGLIDDLFPSGDTDTDVKDNYRRVSTVGYRLAQAVLGAQEQPLEMSETQKITMCHVPVSFPVDNFLFKTASQFRVVETRIKNGTIRSRISSLGMGSLIFVSIPGELFPKVLRSLPPESLAGKQPLWLGMGQDWLGYFVEPADYQNPKLKYWTDLSVHKNASSVLLQGMSKALLRNDCAEWIKDY